VIRVDYAVPFPRVALAVLACCGNIDDMDEMLPSCGAGGPVVVEASVRFRVFRHIRRPACGCGSADACTLVRISVRMRPRLYALFVKVKTQLPFPRPR